MSVMAIFRQPWSAFFRSRNGGNYQNEHSGMKAKTLHLGLSYSDRRLTCSGARSLMFTHRFLKCEFEMGGFKGRVMTVPCEVFCELD
jgi:hypothetical protein